MTDTLSIRTVDGAGTFLDLVAAKATANMAAFSGIGAKRCGRLLARMIAEADLFFGVFPDPDAVRGFSIAIIKGEGDPTAQGLTVQRQWNAVNCRCPEEAEAMRRVYGDGARLN